MKFIALIGLSLTVLAGPAAAQSGDWNYKATLYGWFPGISTTIETPRFGTVESELSTSDVLSDLKMAFMATFIAQHGNWSFGADLLYSDLSSTQATPIGLAFGDVTVGTKLTAVSGYALYRVTHDPKVQLDLGVGFRNFNLAVDVDVSPGLAAGGQVSSDGNWTDPLVAARVNFALDDKWFLTGFADFGGTSSSDQTWQVYAGVGYNFNERWSSQIGYRYLDFSRELQGFDTSLSLSGALVAVSYNF